MLLDETCCDPLYRKAIRVSVGAALKVPFAYAGPHGSLANALEAHGFAQIALSPGGKADIRTTERRERMALYLGTEGDGLPAELLARLETVRIPIAAGFDSLNVAAASAIALHEIRNRAVEWRMANYRCSGRSANDFLIIPLFTIHRCGLLQGPHAVGQAGDLLVPPVRRQRSPAGAGASALLIGESGPSSVAVSDTTSAARSLICSRSSALLRRSSPQSSTFDTLVGGEIRPQLLVLAGQCGQPGFQAVAILVSLAIAFSMSLSLAPESSVDICSVMSASSASSLTLSACASISFSLSSSSAPRIALQLLAQPRQLALAAVELFLAVGERGEYPLELLFQLA